MQRVHPGKPRADHDDIAALSACGVAFAGNGLQGGHVFALPWDSSRIADQHSTRRAKAQETKRPVRAAYFATWNALSPYRDFRRLHARRGKGNQLGFPAHDALASFENSSFKPI